MSPKRGSTRRSLEVRNFAQIRHANIEFGDLTVLVGPQGSGKSLLLQLWKLALDHREVIPALREAGHDVRNTPELLDVYLGQGMRRSWRSGTRVLVDRREINPQKYCEDNRSSDGSVFFIPAHRALLLAEGWPAPFLKLNADTPAVARIFSQNLYSLFGQPAEEQLFPQERRLKGAYRDAIDDAVFHGGRVHLGKEQLKKRLELNFKGNVRLPFMTWTAGQREFTPLLLGLYHLLPQRQQRKREQIDWVVIEEPEMGLHPKAISVVMLLVLDLLWRGYRVIISTHTPLVLDIVFTLRVMQETAANPSLLCKAFGIEPNPDTRSVMEAVLGKQKSYRTFSLRFGKTGVVSQDISELDPSSFDENVAGWGGLTEFSSRFNNVVAEAVNAASSKGS